MQETRDGLEITGNPKLLDSKEAIEQHSNIIIRTYNDHRMAMAFAVAKLALPGIVIKDKECVAKSFPWFWEEWDKLMKRET